MIFIIKCPPERAHDLPTVAASVALELVGVGIRKRHTISHPNDVRGVFFLAPSTLQGAVHLDRFSQGRDDSSGTPLKLQIFDKEREEAGLGVSFSVMC